MLLQLFWRWAVNELSPISSTPYLDVELLLGHILGLTRAQLHSQATSLSLSSGQQQLFEAYISRRKKGEPIAYLLGQQEFWSLLLKVTADVLIPRPETELLVQLLLERYSNERRVIADLGTGSGAVALALAQERSSWHIVATDISPTALQVAELNMQRYGVKNVELRLGNWCDAFFSEEYFDVIVSNPPYLAKNDGHFQFELGLTFEPEIALIAGKDGLNHLEAIVALAGRYLLSGGYLFLEHGYNQSKSVANFFLRYGYHSIEQHADLADHQRVSIGKWH